MVQQTETLPPGKVRPGRSRCLLKGAVGDSCGAKGPAPTMAERPRQGAFQPGPGPRPAGDEGNPSESHSCTQATGVGDAVKGGYSQTSPGEVEAWGRPGRTWSQAGRARPSESARER